MQSVGPRASLSVEILVSTFHGKTISKKSFFKLIAVVASLWNNTNVEAEHGRREPVRQESKCMMSLQAIATQGNKVERPANTLKVFDDYTPWNQIKFLEV